MGRSVERSTVFASRDYWNAETQIRTVRVVTVGKVNKFNRVGMVPETFVTLIRVLPISVNQSSEKHGKLTCQFGLLQHVLLITDFLGSRGPGDWLLVSFIGSRSRCDRLFLHRRLHDEQLLAWFRDSVRERRRFAPLGHLPCADSFLAVEIGNVGSGDRLELIVPFGSGQWHSSDKVEIPFSRVLCVNSGETRVQVTGHLKSLVNTL